MVFEEQFIKRADIGAKRTYITHYNGGEPFLVEVSSKLVRIYVTFTGKLVKQYTKFEGIWDGENYGTSLLIKLTATDYVFVGDKVYSFSVPKGDPIVEMYSLLGNNDVPYPVAFSKTRIYWLLDHTWILQKNLAVPRTERRDAYRFVYDSIHSPDTTSKIIHVVSKYKLIASMDEDFDDEASPKKWKNIKWSHDPRHVNRVDSNKKYDWESNNSCTIA